MTSWSDREFDEMLQVGGESRPWHAWFIDALKHVPVSILEDLKPRLLIIATGHSDGCRIPPSIKEGRDEIIIIAGRILPKQAMMADNPKVRYFMHAVLHEIAHIAKEHVSPNEITKEENTRQEQEADNLAMDWFNKCELQLRGEDSIPFTDEELKKSEAEATALIEANYDGSLRIMRD